MIKRNIVANMIGRAWGVVSVYLFVPLYLKFLGAEAYGLVGFFATLLGVLAFADMGLTATLNREMARLSARKDSAGEQADLLRTYETAYAWISLLLAGLIWLLAPLIADYWLQSNALDPREIAFVIRIMGLSIALQLPANLYIGGLMGLQRQVLTNSLQMGWGLARGAGAVLVLWLVSPTAVAFFWWQLLANVAYCLAARTALRRAVSHGVERPRFKWLVFQNTWRYALGMAGMAFLSTILMQTDKLAVSKMLPLESFGYYMLAVALAGAPRMLASPIGAAVFPRLTALVEAGDRSGLVRLYYRTTALLVVAIIPAGLTLAMFSGDFLFAWTGNLSAARQVGLAAALLIVGEVMQAITVPPYHLALAHGDVRLNLQVCVAAVVVITPLLIFLIAQYGVVGAGVSWLAMNACVLPPYMYFVHRRFMPGELRRWCLLGVGRPLLVALPCVLLGRWLAPHSDSRLLTFGMIALVWGAATAATAATIAELRGAFVRRTYGVLGVSYGTE
jgi:O-antigen/teichoic acid export membrane protein